MEAYIFHALVEKLRENEILEDSTIVSLEEKVAIFLYAVAKNASNETLQDRFQHSGQTISRHFGDVLEAITKLASIYIRPPSLRPHPVLRRSHFHPYFNDCIGAIDGTHIPMTISPHEQEPYRNRKQTITQNVMVACDFDLRFVHVHPGWEGSASDARVLQDALNHGFQVPHGKYYLVDAGYANTPQFLAPYRGTRYHLQEQAQVRQRPRNRRELFNLRHAQLRNHIERIIGIVKKRFPVLKVATHYSPSKQVDISMACCVLHNFIRLHDGDVSWLNNDTPDIDPHLIVDVPTGDENYTSDVGAFNNTREAGNHLRDYIADKLWEDYIARRA
ncbi:putative nuclease HARBI1 isoform X1 [Triticum dicoccoides]|uniref:putative nuclease HARBI1 isoform X1 n=1 Tax=Triticum dicoccoides TaxID=85692 RepID=UPI0018918367|nr:putative nuclease HARBI1 isoform X1 [Triticum dicoccoides]